MEGQSSVECGSQPGSDVGSDHHHGRHQRHQLGSSRQQYLDHETDHLGHEDDYLDDEEVGTDSMTADNNVNGHRRTASPADCTMNRKSNKPQMEKKRRQRINRCLSDLKKLVLEGMKKDPSRYSKLEKADILEMTVRHVQALHRYEAAGGRMIGGGRLMGGEEAKYRAGFTHCAAEITKYLASMDDLPHDLHKKVLTHLNAIATTVTSNVNSNTTCVQNSINVVPNILVLNTSAGAPVPQPPMQPIAFQESAGNSLGAQPQVTLVTTSRQTTMGPIPSQQQHGGLQILTTRLNNGDLTVVLPATYQVVPQSNNNNVRAPPSPALQTSAPVLTAILTSDRNHITPSNVVQPPALSISSEDSALGTETLDTSDSDISRSGVSTPVSSMSSAGSPAPAEDAGRSSPKRAGTSRSSPTLKGQVWNSNMFREDLGSSSCPNRSQSRRQPVLAPKPTHPTWSTCSAPPDHPSRRKKDKSPPPPPPAEPQSMWRPWR